MSSFGKQRLADFYVDPKYININHGSYGYSPKSVIQYRRSIEQEAEFNTDKWFRRQSQMFINEMRSYIASKINCSTKNVFIIQNATDRINCIAKSMKWTSNDAILLPTTAYASIRKTITVIKERYGVTIVDLPFTEQDFQSPQNIQLKIQDFVNSYPKKIKMAVFDHVSSVPSVVFPIDTLQVFLQEKGIMLIVDGAHAIGNINVNMAELNANAYFSNFHKWSFCPKNASFLYLDDSLRDVVKPSITGNFYGQGPQRQYYWTGTRDFSSYLTIRKGIEYHQSFGMNSVIFHNHNLALLAGKRMAQIWGTKLLTQDPRLTNSMVNVEAPSKDYTLCHKLAMDMLYEVNCFPHFLSFDGKVYCRISAQIYNDITDFEFAATKFLQYLKKATNAKKQLKEK